MKEIIKLTASDFIEKVKSLGVGEHFDFAADTEHVSAPQSEDELSEWYGVQKIYLFDNEMCIVSKYGGTGCRVFCTEDDYLTVAVEDMFRNMNWDFVYIVNNDSQTQELSVTLTSDFCFDIRTDSGERLLIPSSKVRELTTEIDKNYAVEDLNSKIAESGEPMNFSDDELRQMASEIIDRREDCDLIYEIYWEIVENVIKEFSERKQH